MALCASCHGDGFIGWKQTPDGPEEISCRVCGGTGEVCECDELCETCGWAVDHCHCRQTDADHFGIVPWRYWPLWDRAEGED